MRPILIDRAVVQNQIAAPEAPYVPTGLEILPWRPVLDALALQICPDIVEATQRPQHSGPSEFEFQAEQTRLSPPVARGHKASVSGQKRNLSMPQVVSISNANTPGSGRASSQFQTRCNQGYFLFRVDGEASKKRSRSGPVSLPVLQGWGIGCVAPSELTDDALM